MILLWDAAFLCQRKQIRIQGARCLHRHVSPRRTPRYDKLPQLESSYDCRAVVRRHTGTGSDVHASPLHWQRPRNPGPHMRRKDWHGTTPQPIPTCSEQWTCRRRPMMSAPHADSRCKLQAHLGRRSFGLTRPGSVPGLVTDRRPPREPARSRETRDRKKDATDTGPDL